MNTLISNKQAGFSLIELMISLVLGLVISGAIIQIMVSNSVTDKLNRAVASVQENGRYAISRLRSDVITAGRYESLYPELDRSVDVVDEGNYVKNHPVALPGDFASRATLGSKEGTSGANDTLVVGMQALRDCRGFKLGYDARAEFYVVNEYFIDGTSLKCRGFDGRYLRGQKAAQGHAGHAAYTLLDDVISFQVLYGITRHDINGDNTARPTRFVSADQIAAELGAGGQVVAIRIALLLTGDGEITVDSVPKFRLLDAPLVQPSEKRLYKQFETTITLRNSKNFMRSRKV